MFFALYGSLRKKTEPTMTYSIRSVKITALALALAFTALAQQRNKEDAGAPHPIKPANWVDPDKTGPPGSHYATFSSKLAKSDVSCLVYLPPDYETATDKRYPVVYWLHGLNGIQRAGAKFVTQLDRFTREGKAPAMIVVMVNGMRDSFYNDSPDGKWPIESVIIKELIPHVDQTYRTIAKRETRGVESFSMGGYGAGHLGFKYPEVFGMVGVMSGALIPVESISAPNLVSIFKKMFGSDAAYFDANHPMALARKNADAIRGRTAIRIAVGGDDNLLSRDKALHDLLTELKIESEWEVVPGVPHNSTLFYDKLGDHAFAWYLKALSR